ncbi:MAG: hypothetical protein PWP54_1596 [Thermosipho sp. (in: thermotogales)]|nr:hypothetical protein [Thermosipho sp. (in: thermotogales)]
MKNLTSRERVFTAVSYKGPDRVPLFLTFTFYGAKELGMSIKKYFSSSENVILAQKKLREKYKHDFYYAFYYASLEIEAFGGESIFIDDGPPNAGEPIIKNLSDIDNLNVPDVKNSEILKKVFETEDALRNLDAPVVGVIISPFSLPMTSGMIWNESFIFDGNKVFSHFFEEQRLGFFAIKNINKNLLPGDKVQLFQENKPRIFSYFKKRSKYIHILRLPFELWNTPVLSDPEILKIYNTLSHVSNKFPKAEAEWTIKNGKIYFLQIRPITTQSNFPNYRFYLDHKGEFQGLGVSSGYAEGTLFFWKNKIDENLENKILVVHEMTPDLLPYYSKIKGIISETGSVLCHGAILSREFEIPCVILPKAAQLLRFFKKVAIDGYEGKVIKLE